MPESPDNQASFTGPAAVGVAASDIAVMFMGSTLLTPLYALYQRTFGFSEVTLTLVYSVYAAGNLVALFFLGRLSDQIGRRRASLPAIMMAGVATVVFLFARGTGWLFAGRILSGLAIGLASGTITAWIAELTTEQGKSRAATTASGANLVGLAMGPLVSGLLAQYAPAPLHTSFVLYLLIVIATGLLTRKTPETVVHRVSDPGRIHLRPRLGVPREIRARFLSPAVISFAAFGLGGFYAALAPTVLMRDLHYSNLALAGLVAFELYLVAALTVLFSGRVGSLKSMLAGSALLVPGLALLVLAQALHSLPVLLIGTALSGVSMALGYRGSLHVINLIAPAERRSEVVSSYLVACYLGNSVPVIGVGIARHILEPFVADLCFAIIIAMLALAALATGIRFGGRSRR